MTDTTDPGGAARATPGALAGIKVVDLSRILAGPLCAQMLADHGADVIKVEPPAGDDTRRWGPPFLDADTSAYYYGLNRNKQNIVVDLAAEDGQQLLRRLLASADVLVENFKSGTLARWGLDDAAIRSLYPRLVHVRITGYGIDGPKGGTPGYDAAIQAAAGLISVNGEAGGTPHKVGTPIVDIVTGHNAFAGALLALYERDRSGVGQLVEAALLDSCVSILHPHPANWFLTKTDPVPTGSSHPNVVPYDVFVTKDGPYYVAVGNDQQFVRLMEALGRPEVGTDPAYVTNADRARNRVALTELLAELLADWTRDELAAALESRGVPGGPVRSVGETLCDPQVRHREMVIEREDYVGVGVPIKLERTPGSVRFAPRSKDADSVAVRQQLGPDDR
jgi:crotonobetainyl-CoA:carnitine CoA-transferase CaiB-like acyl-CoA transferase